MTYEIVENAPFPSVIKRDNQDGSTTFIPMDESNLDYKTYLRWLNGEENLGGN